MIVNTDKFQAMILSSDKKENKYDLKINGSIISSEKSVTLLGIEIDNKLNFEKQVANICRKANNQLNAIGRIQNLKSLHLQISRLLRARSSLTFRQL